jgi:hypothetical protein
MAKGSHNMLEINSGQLGFFSPKNSVLFVGFKFCDLSENQNYIFHFCLQIEETNKNSL